MKMINKSFSEIFAMPKNFPRVLYFHDKVAVKLSCIRLVCATVLFFDVLKLLLIKFT